MPRCLFCRADTPPDDHVFVTRSGAYCVCLRCYETELARMRAGRVAR